MLFYVNIIKLAAGNGFFHYKKNLQVPHKFGGIF